MNERFITQAKENRFTLSSRILADEGISVQVINSLNDAPADYNLATKVLRLNEARPKAKNPVDALVYDRGKLFHELGHALFTIDKAGLRERLANQSKTPQEFLDLSNVLEDGRIERLVCKDWQGAKGYLDALLHNMLADGASDSPINGLVLYVRTGLFRNEGEKKYWQPYMKEIDKALAAASVADVCQIADEICKKLYKPKDQNPQGNGEGQGKGKGNNQSDDKNQGEDQGKEENEGTGDSGNDTGKSGEKSEEENETESEASENGGGSSSGDKSQSEGKTDGKIDSDVQDLIDEIVQQAKDQVKDEAQSDYESILIEAEELSKNEVQEFANSDEENNADELASMFTSLLVEVNRTKYTPAREGLLNSLALANALTSRKCFHMREESLGTPYVALCIDCSGSQNSRMNRLSEACRILYGALQKAKIETKIITYGSGCIELNVIPKNGLHTLGSTATHSAMKIANNWFEEKQAERALMVVLTDGAPDLETSCQDQKRRCETLNGYVLGVRVGFQMKDAGECFGGGLQDQFHTYFNLPDVSKLPQAMETPLEQFLTGV
jgi:hypothetical protein